MPMLFHFFACNKEGLKSDPSIPAQKPRAALIESMPLVHPLELLDSATYYDVTSEYYQNEYNRMSLRRPLLEIPFSSGQGTYNFTEYKFTINSEQPEPVYAMMTGYLFHLNPGDTYSYVFTEAGSFVADEEMLVLEAAPQTMNRYIFPKDVPVLRACIVRNLSFDRALLIEEINENYSEGYIKNRGYEGPDALFNDWLVNSTIPLLVKGGSQIGLTKSDILTSPSPQRLSLFFEIGGWGNNEENAKTYFFYRSRFLELEGHPMIAVIRELSVIAGYVDYVGFRDNPYEGRDKSKLIEDAQSGSDYDPIAIDPEQHPVTIIIQKKIPDSITVPSSIHLPDNYGSTRIRVCNPLNVPVQITGYDPNEVTIIPTNFSSHDQIITFQSTQNSPVSPNNKINITFNYLDSSTGELRLILPITLVFYEFQMIPIKFHKLSDSLRTVSITYDQLEKIIDEANLLLGRQTNVYLYPIEENDIILHNLDFNQEDLGEVLEQDIVFNYGLDKIYTKLNEFSTENNCHHIFTWETVTTDNTGYTWKSSLNPINRFLVTLQVIKDLDLTDSKVLQDCAQTLIHELGHWLSGTYISLADFILCASGAEHFRHDDCASGDHGLFANLMNPGSDSDSIKLTLDQAEVYVQYALQVEE